jgi:hypothetical protein
MRRFGQLITLVALLVGGIWLLGRPSELGRETTARQDALRRAFSPSSMIGSDEDPHPGEAGGGESAVPVVVDFGQAAALAGMEPPSQYELWLRGAIDLDRETGRATQAEVLERQLLTLERAEDPSVQLATEVSPLLPPIAQTTFESITFANTAYIPPDPEMAAGPNHLVVAVNVYVAIYNKHGAKLMAASPFNLFAQTECKDTFLFDPNVLYDEESDRWLLGYAAGPQRADGGYCLLVSTSGDPTGQWLSYFFRVNSTSGWLDFPHAGVGDNHIFVGGNLFNPSTNYFVEAVLVAFPKAQLYAGQAVNWSRRGLGGFNGSNNYFAPQPLKLHGAANGTWPSFGNTHYFLLDDVQWNAPTDEYRLDYMLMSWNPVTNSANVIRILNFGTSGAPLNVPQLNGDPIEANDLRPLDFEYRNGYGWTAMTVACNPGGGAVNCIRWAQVNLTTGVLGPAGSSLFASSGVHRFFPDVAVNHCNDMVIGYSRGSATMWPGMWYSGRRAIDDRNELRGELLLRAGEKAYTSFETLSLSKPARRWGDYTGMTPDPDGLRFWYVGQYSSDDPVRANWATFVGSFTLSPTLSCGELTTDFVYLPQVSR